MCLRTQVQSPISFWKEHGKSPDEINFDNLKELTNIYQRQSVPNCWGALIKAEWPREHSLISGQVSHHNLTWKLRSLATNRMEAGLANWPNLWITQLQLGQGELRGHPRAPNTEQHPGRWGRAHPPQTVRGSESGGGQGREDSHREWQHFHRHKHAWINPRTGPKQTSRGQGQESKAVPQGRRAPQPSARAGEGWHSTSPVGKGPGTGANARGNWNQREGGDPCPARHWQGHSAHTWCPGGDPTPAGA